MRLTAAPCQQLRYGLTEGGTVAIDAPDPSLPLCPGSTLVLQNCRTCRRLH